MSRPRSRTSYGKVGFTIPGFAREFDLDENTVRRAVKLKEIATVRFAGLERIPPAEADRFRETFRPIIFEATASTVCASSKITKSFANK